MKFGTDGIRGIYGSELKDVHAYKIGKKLGEWTKRHNKSNNQNLTIVIGRDTRVSGKALLNAFACGAAEQGIQVTSLGVVPTPAVEYYVQHGGFLFGVMITASHNSKEYNGIKVFAASGNKISASQEQEIEKSLSVAKSFCFKNVSIKTKRPTEYTNYLRGNLCAFDQKIAIDCANGSAVRIAKKVFKNCNVVWVGASPNGKNINKNCGSTKISKLVGVVKQNNCFAGFAFDGDADRCLAVDEKGNVMSGDHILFVLSNQMKSNGRLLDGVVATELSSLALCDALKQNDIKLVQTKVGDKYVKQKMDELGWNLGGEQSGHIIVGDKSNTGDGILTAIELIGAMANSKKSLSCLAKKFVPLCRVEINVCTKSEMYSDAIKIANELNNSLSGERVLIRKSGTENVVRIMCESGSKRRATMFATYFQALVSN